MRKTEVTRACGKVINCVKRGSHKLALEDDGEIWDVIYILATSHFLFATINEDSALDFSALIG